MTDKFEEAVKRPAARRLIKKLENCKPEEFSFYWEQLGDEVQDDAGAEQFFKEEQLLTHLRKGGALKSIMAAVEADKRGKEEEAFTLWVQAWDNLA